MAKGATGQRITPVILAGGSGTRLWPLSSDEKPKQFQAIAGQLSMFQQTLLRVGDTKRFTAPVIVGNEGHKALLETELAACGVEPAAIILEPEGRNTAPAVALAALTSFACKFSDYMLIMPSDHYIRDPDAMISAIDKARSAAQTGAFVTFGIAPDGPETCYGYIKQGSPVITHTKSKALEGIFSVEQFVEKPPRHKAVTMLQEGCFYWNSGMFLFPVTPLIQEMQVLSPGIIAACQDALVKGKVSGQTVQPHARSFAQAEHISIDYAVMERTARATVVPVDPLWSDVGSWTAVWEISERDNAENVTIGDVILHDVKGAYVRSEGPVTAVVGLDDVIVVNTGDAVIVAAKSHAQEIRQIAEAVRQRKDQSAPQVILPVKKDDTSKKPVRRSMKAGPETKAA